MRNEFNFESSWTIGVEFATRLVSIDDSRIKAQVWATGARTILPRVSPFVPMRPQREDKTILPSPQRASHFFPLSYSPSCLFTRTNETLGINVSFRFYRGALGALLLYDVTESSSFSNIKTWVEELRHYTSPHIITMLVGNRQTSGHLRAVPTEVAVVFASAFRPDILWLNSVAKSLRALPYHRSYRGKRHDVYGDLSTQHVQRRDCI